MTFPVMPTRQSRAETLIPNLGVYLDRAASSVPDRAMTDCLNMRVKEGKVRNDNMGWNLFAALSDPAWENRNILIIDEFLDRTGTTKLVFGTRFDLYRWDDGSSTAKYLTPIESAGNTGYTNGSTAVTGVGTSFTKLKAGDWLHSGEANYRELGAVPATAWLEIASVTDDTNLDLVDAWTASTVGGLPYTGRMTFTGATNQPWSADVFPDAPGNQDLWFATNGSQIVKWDGTAAEVTIITPGFTCKGILFQSNMLLYFDLVEAGESKPSSVRNSAIGDPENVTTLEASEFTVPDGVDFIRSMRRMGSFIVAYCDNSFNTLEFIGPPINWLIRTAVPDFGVISERVIADFGNYHEVLSQDRAYKFDGVNLLEFGPQVFREVLRTFDRNRASQALAIFDQENGEIQWVIPLVSDPDGAPSRAFTEHYLENVGRNPVPVTIRDLPATAAGSYLDTDTKTFADITEGFDLQSFPFDDRFYSEAFPLTLFGDKDGNVWKLGTSSNQDGGAIESRARFPRRPIADGDRKGVVHRVEPFTEKVTGATYGLLVTLWVSDYREGELTKAGEETVDLTHTARRFAPFRAGGLVREVEFSTNGVNEVWALSGYSIKTSPAGGR